MTSKKKLLVLAGAGASVDFGMPNVNDVSKILAEATRERFPLLFDQSRGLFEYFEDQLAALETSGAAIVNRAPDI